MMLHSIQESMKRHNDGLDFREPTATKGPAQSSFFPFVLGSNSGHGKNEDMSPRLKRHTGTDLAKKPGKGTKVPVVRNEVSCVRHRNRLRIPNNEFW